MVNARRDFLVTLYPANVELVIVMSMDRLANLATRPQGNANAKKNTSVAPAPNAKMGLETSPLDVDNAIAMLLDPKH